VPASTRAGEARKAAGTRGGPLRLRRPSVRVFARHDRPKPTTAELEYMTDFLAEFGMEPDLELYARGGGNSFTRMCGELLDGPDGALPTLDAVLLAYHLPDLRLAEIAGGYLAHRCPGNPTAFSVAGQGVGAPFTALRILDCMHRSGTVADGAVFVLDQSTVPYRDSDTHDRSVGDCAVLLCTGADEEVLLDFLGEEPVVDPADLLDASGRPHPRHRVVIGRMLADRLDAGFRARHSVIEAPAHRLCTGPWAALAEHWPPDRYTIVADYDPHAGRLFQAGLSPGPST
jgi:hypothetical protein